jgi:hypothetical protein
MSALALHVSQLSARSTSTLQRFNCGEYGHPSTKCSKPVNYELQSKLRNKYLARKNARVEASSNEILLSKVSASMQQVGSKRIRIDDLLSLSSDPVQSVPARLEIATENRL